MIRYRRRNNEIYRLLTRHDFWLKASVKNISFDVWNNLPGVHNLYGDLSLHNKSGAFAFRLQNIELPKQKLFPLGWPRTSLNGSVDWDVLDKGVFVKIPKLVFGVQDKNSIIPNSKQLYTKVTGKVLVPNDPVSGYQVKQSLVSLESQSVGKNIADGLVI